MSPRFPNSPHWPAAACLGALVCATVACGTSRSAEPAVLTVSVASGSVIAPDTVPAGWTRLRVEEADRGHIIALFELPADANGTAVAAFLAALDTAKATPPPAIARGGPEIGDTAEVVLQLETGRYLLACLSRRDGHRHATMGESRLVEVRGPSSDRPGPEASHELDLVDFAFGTPTPWAAGRHLLAVRNTGRQDHQLRIDRLHDGVTFAEWLEAEGGETSDPVAGVARIGPGQQAFLPMDLAPGEYVLYCLIPDPASGRPHVEMGMMRSIRVE